MSHDEDSAMRPALYTLLVLLGSPSLAWAGMPSVVLTDMARLRLQNISFFLAIFLLSAWFIQLLWNYLRRDWTFLPRLRYMAAVSLVTLWGLLFVLVLTMISGARERMTPGAWEKQGVSYRLADPERDAQVHRDRRERLEKLRAALWDYAFSHEGKFPPTATSDSGIPAALWQVPDPSAMPYLYVGGSYSKAAIPVVYEPEVYGPSRYVLYANGSIRLEELDSILSALPLEKR
jgi:hypothetical protein